jgi:hypothetical protein
LARIGRDDSREAVMVCVVGMPDAVRVGVMLAGLQGSWTNRSEKAIARGQNDSSVARQAAGCWMTPGWWRVEEERRRRQRESCAQLSRVSRSPDRQGGNVCRCDRGRGRRA